jgi:hypothetical protein
MLASTTRAGRAPFPSPCAAAPLAWQSAQSFRSGKADETSQDYRASELFHGLNKSSSRGGRGMKEAAEGQKQTESKQSEDIVKGDRSSPTGPAAIPSTRSSVTRGSRVRRPSSWETSPARRSPLTTKSAGPKLSISLCSQKGQPVLMSINDEAKRIESERPSAHEQTPPAFKRRKGAQLKAPGKPRQAVRRRPSADVSVKPIQISVATVASLTQSRSRFVSKRGGIQDGQLSREWTRSWQADDVGDKLLFAEPFAKLR